MVNHDPEAPIAEPTALPRAWRVLFNRKPVQQRLQLIAAAQRMADRVLGSEVMAPSEPLCDRFETVFLALPAEYQNQLAKRI